MLHKPLLIPPSSVIWDEAARAILTHPLLAAAGTAKPRDLSGIRVVVPTFVHVQALKAALLRYAGATFVPPRIVTLAGWCALLSPENERPPGEGARLMDIYAELRQHAWLKKLFSARRNTDLLPLAQMLLTLSDELTTSLLPGIWGAGDEAENLWQHALAQLAPEARRVVSDEAQLVWSIWKSQLDGNDALTHRYRQLMHLAEQANEVLVWIAPSITEPFDLAFLQAYAERQPVVPILLGWNRAAIAPAFANAWPELLDDASDNVDHDNVIESPQHLALSPATNMEQEAQRGAQSIIDWLQDGKTSIAIVAQDRMVARRLRALLERSQVFVADETGWKLSTTRAASAIAAWFDVVAARAETVALLDLLKSPFVFAGLAGKETQLIVIEAALRRANVLGGWDAVRNALAAMPDAHELTTLIAREAAQFGGRKSIAQWGAATMSSIRALDMWQALQGDAAGRQVLDLLQAIVDQCQRQVQPFSFAEWRAFVSLQLESTSFLAPGSDRRVVMLPLNGAQLRRFDAVLMLGCDAAHLPSQPNETLFFANTVRRELGLATRESRQRQQLRDFAALLSCNGEVVLSWQTQQDGEPNPVSSWVERLQLVLRRAGAAGLPPWNVQISQRSMQAIAQCMPTPVAPHLLPGKLSASGYNSLVACPYQFFATRMLGLSGMDELVDMPEKRDYGDWLHNILNRYHEAIRDGAVALQERESVLRAISASVFDQEIATNAGALAYASRWEKVMPAYLAWANGHEEAGWQFAFGERKFEKVLRWEEGEIVLHGRVDRIDENAAGDFAVLDYKTKNPAALREKLKEGEDRQLAFYGILSDLPLDGAHYVALETTRGKIDDVEAANYKESTHMLEQQLSANLHNLSHGAPLPATGIESVCEYCAVRGLCRKGAW